MGRSSQEKRREPHSVFSNIGYVLRDIARISPAILIMLCVQIIASVAAPLFGIYLPKVATELVLGNADIFDAAWTMVAFAFSMAVVHGMRCVVSGRKSAYFNLLRRNYQKKIFYRSLECDYSLIESAEGQKLYAKGMEPLMWGDWSSVTRLIDCVLEMIVGAATFILYSGIVITLNPILIVLPAVISLAIGVMVRKLRLFRLAKRDENAVLMKRIDYVIYRTQETAFNKDIRLYNMADWFKYHIGKVIDGIEKHCHEEEWYGFTRVAMLANATQVIRDGVAYAYLIWAVLEGTISVSDFMLYFGAIAGFEGFMSRIFNNFAFLQEKSSELNDWRMFMENNVSPDPACPASAPTQTPSIEFRDVSFSYDGKKQVLDHFSFCAEAGERIALVGANGAGKTTVVKLLCGLYKPDSGKILIGGVDANKLRREERFALFSAVFQDIALFPVTLAENIAMCSCEKADFARARDCLEQAGLGAYVNDLKRNVTRAVDENGIMFSGGELQKLLMARALYRDAPIMVLDEPTAALDAIAENETYQQLDSLAKGKTALYISHRLASTRFCDRIIVLSGGRAAEVGTHDELLSRGGEYAHMFEVQSYYYQKGDEEE